MMEGLYAHTLLLCKPKTISDMGDPVDNDYLKKSDTGVSKG